MCAGIGNITLKSVLKNKHLTECYAYEDTYEVNLDNFDVSNLPTFTINEETHKAENIVWPNGTVESRKSVTCVFLNKFAPQKQQKGRADGSAFFHPKSKIRSGW